MPYDKNGKFFVSTGDQLFTGTHLGKTYVNGRAYGVGENDMMRLTRRLEETRREEERKKRAEEERKKRLKTKTKIPIIPL